MCTLSITLGLVARTIIRGQEKFTRSRQWESLSTLGGQLVGHLEDPKTSSPLRRGRQFVKDELDV
jgi:hypothetical protein